MSDTAVSCYGRLDLAFNNAGLELGGPIDGTDFNRVFGVNVWDVFAAMKHEVAAMSRTGGGAIANTSSIAGQVGIADFSLCSASKHAVEGLTKTAALELAGFCEVVLSNVFLSNVFLSNDFLSSALARGFFGKAS